MQGITIGLLMYNNGMGMSMGANGGGAGGGPQQGQLTLERAEDEYNAALSRMIGEQYELLNSGSGIIAFKDKEMIKEMIKDVRSKG